MDIIKVKNAGYAEYEELLLKRDQVRKEARNWHYEYIRVFGDMVSNVFQTKIQCIQKKKAIAYIQTLLNKGQSVDNDALKRYLEEEMREYNAKLADMLREKRIVDESTPVSAKTIEKVKKLYHKLAKMLHPDINPKTNENENLQALWNMIVAAYNANDLEEMEAAEILVNRALQDMGLEDMEIQIPDIEAKIAAIQEQIYHIMETEPYRYKYLLEDEAYVTKRTKELQDELQEYRDYESELDRVLEQFVTGGVSFTWKMN